MTKHSNNRVYNVDYMRTETSVDVLSNGMVTRRGKVVGMIRGHIYTTRRTPETYFKKYQGYGISVVILVELQRQDVDVVRVIYYGKRGRKTIERGVDELMAQESVFIPGWDEQKIVRDYP